MSGSVCAGDPNIAEIRDRECGESSVTKAPAENWADSSKQVGNHSMVNIFLPQHLSHGYRSSYDIHRDK
jgi:hypothetical protein